MAKKPNGSNGGEGPKLYVSQREGREGMTLAERLNAIRAELPIVGRSGENREQRYTYAKEEDILEAVLPLELKWGVMLVFAAKNVRQEHHGRATHKGVPYLTANVELEVTILNVDDPAERLVVSWWGEAEDFSDKGTYQAYTGGTRTFRQKLYSIASADDPENEKTNGVAGRQASSAPPREAPGAAWRERPRSEKQLELANNLLGSHHMNAPSVDPKALAAVKRLVANPATKQGRMSEAIDWLKGVVEAGRAQEEAAAQKDQRKMNLEGRETCSECDAPLVLENGACKACGAFLEGDWPEGEPAMAGDHDDDDLPF